MKYLKSILLSLILCLVASTGYAQATDEVTLTVSSDGLTKEEATKNALRSAIEQAYGTFVSANTTILNDELVKDEIVTIANGNIKSYEEISSTAMPDGTQFVTLKTTVSVSKLISYAQSKGAETEFAGATFGMNLRLQEMNKENEKKVLDNLLTQIKAMMPYVYDRTLEVKDPAFVEYSDSLLQIEFIITETPNKNMFSIKDLIDTTLKSISLSENEMQQYHDLNIPMYYLCAPSYYKPVGESEYSGDSYYLRNSWLDWTKEFLTIMMRELFQFRIIDNQGNVSYLEVDLSNLEFSEQSGGYDYDGAGFLPHRSYIRYGLFSVPKGVYRSYIESNLDPTSIFIYHIIRCCMIKQRDIVKDESDKYILKPYPVYIKVNGYIPKSDISKYNNFRVERSDLKYE